MTAPLIDSIVTFDLSVIEGRTPATGTNTVLMLLDTADDATDGNLYVTAAQVDGDSGNLTADAVASIKAVLAASPRVGGVYVWTYDSGAGGGPEAPSDALADARDAGIIALWSYIYVVVHDRADAAIADAADWIAANATGRAIVAGQLATSSILSGTVPATTAASAGASSTVIYYDDDDTAPEIERIVGRLASTDTSTDRPPGGIITLGTLGAYSTELTQAEVLAASGRDVGQARCLVSAPLYPGASTRTVWRGYTVGGTLLEVETGAVITEARILAAIATLVESRSLPGGTPLRTTDADAAAIRATVEGVLTSLRSAGYIESGISADPATGRPPLPDGFEVSVDFNGSTAEIRGWIAYPQDVREITFDLTGFVT